VDARDTVASHRLALVNMPINVGTAITGSLCIPE